MKDPFETLYREMEEEVGLVPDIDKVIPLNKFTSPNKKFVYHSFVVTVQDEFIPVLNNESDGYCWVKLEITRDLFILVQKYSLIQNNLLRNLKLFFHINLKNSILGNSLFHTSNKLFT